MADTADTWEQLLRGRYQPTTRRAVPRRVDSTCGFAQSAVGPFYCPADRKVYLDLSFFNELRTRFGAPGDFAQAYVLAHEVGHHVQTVTGIEAQVRQLQQSNPSQRNELSVRMELQADCYAGVWGHVASQIGARRRARSSSIPAISRKGSAPPRRSATTRSRSASTGRVMPDKFTHGSSEQRVDLVPPRLRRPAIRTPAIRFSERERRAQLRGCSAGCALRAEAVLEGGTIRDRMAQSSGHRTRGSAPRRARQGHRPGALHRRPDAARACCTASPCAARCRAASSATSAIGAGVPWDEITVVTAADIPGRNVVALILDDQPYLADDRVNHAEEPIVLLAHPDKQLLEEARRLVSLRDRAARRRCSPSTTRCAADAVIWGDDNIFKSYLVGRGDVDARLRRAPRSSSRGSTRPARRSSSTSSRTACSPSRIRLAA